MASLANVIKVTKSQYNTLIAGGTITKSGVTYSYDANAIYLIREDGEELHVVDSEFEIQSIEVRIDGISSNYYTWRITPGTTWQDLIDSGARDTTNNCYIIAGANTNIVGVTYVRAVIVGGTSNQKQLYTSDSYEQASISSDVVRHQIYFSIDPSSMN